MATIAEESPRLGVRATCEALGVAPATYYRHQRPPKAPETRSSHRALGPEERQGVLDVLHEPRFVVGWMVAHRESAALAKRLIDETCQRQGISPGQLTLHADRGPSMRSKTVALLLSDLGVTKTHSRPYTSTDNPFSEAQFKTMKYRPEFPDRFGCIQHSRNFCGPFFDWYNHHHRHGSLGLLTPYDVHYDLAEQRLAERARVLQDAFATHPERFPNGVPTPAALPESVWINKPKECGCESEEESNGGIQPSQAEDPTSKPGENRSEKEEFLLVDAH